VSIFEILNLQNKKFFFSVLHLERTRVFQIKLMSFLFYYLVAFNLECFKK